MLSGAEKFGSGLSWQFHVIISRPPHAKIYSTEKMVKLLKYFLRFKSMEGVRSNYTQNSQTTSYNFKITKSFAGKLSPESRCRKDGPAIRFPFKLQALMIIVEQEINVKYIINFS